MDKTELLYDHYKETFSIIKETIIQRNRFFVMVFLVMTLQSNVYTIKFLMVNIIVSNYEILSSNDTYRKTI